MAVIMRAKPSSSVRESGGRSKRRYSGSGKVRKSGMYSEDVSAEGGAVAAAVRAVGAGVRTLPCVSENMLLQVVFAGAAREHLATHAALRHPLFTISTLQSKHTPSTLRLASHTPNTSPNPALTTASVQHCC